MEAGPDANAGPWRRADFRWFFTGQVVSLAGGSMTPVALSFAVLGASGRGSDLALVLAAQSLSLLTFLLVGGATADRLPRTVLVAANLGACLTQTVVATLSLTDSYLGLLITVEAPNGTSAAFTMPALRGVLPHLVEQGALQRANSALATARSSTSRRMPCRGSGRTISWVPTR